MHRRFCLSPPNISGGYGVLILNAILPLPPSCWGFSFALGCGVFFFLVGPNILLLMAAQQRVSILEFLQEKSAHPSTPPSYWYILLIELPYDPAISFLRIMVWIWDRVLCTELKERANSYPRAFLVDWTWKCLGRQGRWPAWAVPWWARVAHANWAAWLRNAPRCTGHPLEPQPGEAGAPGLFRDPGGSISGGSKRLQDGGPGAQGPQVQIQPAACSPRAQRN